MVLHRRGFALRIGASGAAASARRSSISSACGDVADTACASLPQGQRRLLEIAKVLALDPKLVLLDEPHGGLNHAETARLIEHHSRHAPPGPDHPADRARDGRGDAACRRDHGAQFRRAAGGRARRRRSRATKRWWKPISAAPGRRRSRRHRADRRIPGRCSMCAGCRCGLAISRRCGASIFMWRRARSSRFSATTVPARAPR